MYNEARDDAFVLFSDLSELNDDCKNECGMNHDFIKEIEHKVDLLSTFSTQIHNIREILGRQQLKVVFFGRTSSGKSTFINALLGGDQVLPTGMGHTTNCFIQVQGTEENQPSLMVPLGDNGCFTETSVSSIQDVANALNKQPTDETGLVILNWPRDRCPLLQEDVVLVDSPGVDVSRSYDDWIEQFCEDADIFVLVANAESTIMMREKFFFLNVADKVSNPNIVIVENRWDCSEFEVRKIKFKNIWNCYCKKYFGFGSSTIS